MWVWFLWRRGLPVAVTGVVVLLMHGAVGLFRGTFDWAVAATEAMLWLGLMPFLTRFLIERAPSAERAERVNKIEEVTDWAGGRVVPGWDQLLPVRASRLFRQGKEVEALRLYHDEAGRTWDEAYAWQADRRVGGLASEMVRFIAEGVTQAACPGTSPGDPG